MAKFVNYKKHGVTLPKGCKDLIDVLNDAGSVNPSACPHLEPGTTTRDESIEGPLSDMGKHVEVIFRSRNPTIGLTVSAPSREFTFTVQRFMDQPDAYVSFMEEEAQVNEMKNFFAQHGLVIPVDQGMPPQFYPNLPVGVSYDISPMPSDPDDLARIGVELFRKFCGIEESSQVRFHLF